MMPRQWDAPVLDEDDDNSPEDPGPTLVSLHFIRSAIRRRWLACAMAAALGLLIAAGYLVAFPQPHRAKTALVLAHHEDVDLTLAMSTDVGLLMTRTVAAKTITRLNLNMSPDDFLKTVEAEAASPELLSVTLAAPTETEAVRRLAALSSIYLDFRAEQLTLQSTVLINGMQQRITKLQSEVADLTRRIEQLSASSGPTASRLSDTIAQRALIESKIEALQLSVEDLTLRSTSVVSSSTVIDPASADVGGAKRRTALVLMSGLIGGLALGVGAVLFSAITSDRLFRRSDIAEALGVSVPVSVGRIGAVWKGWRWLAPLGAVHRKRVAQRELLAYAIEEELLRTQAPTRLVVAGIDNADEVSFSVGAAANNLARRDYSVTVIDLAKRPSRGLRFTPSTSGSDAPSLLRPRGLPALARSTGDLLPVGRWDEGESTPTPELGDITLVLADVDPAVGADHLAAWADRTIVAVTAGRSSAEKIRTIGELVESAGLELRFAALIRTEATDDSSGERVVPRTASADPSEGLDLGWPAAARSEAR